MVLNKDGLPICDKCGTVYIFEQDEPFAYCNCGTTEWGESCDGMKFRNIQKKQQEVPHQTGHGQMHR
jgi:hypothetical protein